MLEFVIFLFATAGLVRGITKTSLIKSFREKITKIYHSGEYKGLVQKIFWFADSVLNCPLCCGFWSGLVVYLLMHFQLDIVIWGLCGAAGANLYDKIK